MKVWGAGVVPANGPAANESRRCPYRDHLDRRHEALRPHEALREILKPMSDILLCHFRFTCELIKTSRMKVWGAGVVPANGPAANESRRCPSGIHFDRRHDALRPHEALREILKPMTDILLSHFVLNYSEDDAMIAARR